MLTGHLQMLDTISKAPPDQNGETSNIDNNTQYYLYEDISNALSGKSRALFILKLLTMLFTTLDIVRREDDMPESDSRVATRIDPGSGQKVRTSKYFCYR